MSRIVEYTTMEKIGIVQKENPLRELYHLDLFDNDKRMVITREFYQDLASANDWFTVENEDGRGEAVYEEKSRLFCDGCENEPMYDSQRNEWYCPRCNV